MEPVTFALGSSMLKLPGRLDELLQRHPHLLPKGAGDEIPLIQRDFNEIIAILSNCVEVRTAMVRCWMKEVRELSYDIEDFLDQYEYAAGGLHSGIFRCRAPRHRSRRTTCIPEKLRIRLWVANKIREFSVRVQQALKRAEMYKLGASGSASTRCTYAAFGSCLPALAECEAQYLAGIDISMNKLEEWLMTMHDTEEQKLGVASIVGFGGVGKTTLANQLYHKLGHRFECRAFLRASQKPDMMMLLASMLSQVCPNQPPDNWKAHSLISSIRTHLQDKRYWIVVDDLWAISTWDIIKCALPDGNSHSRVLTTTENEDLALQLCGYDSKHVFKKNPLGEDNSRNLFFSSVLGPHRECPSELLEVSNDIIRKCGGLPLAIGIIAGVLANQLYTQEHWDYVNQSLDLSLRTNPTLGGMIQVLNLGYNNLPEHLKQCMLYMSTYKPNNTILKDDLVNQWIAEGFICEIEGREKEEISMIYFNDLIGRKMIQPVHINDNGEVLSCVVHPMVLNFFSSYKSIEENFVTTLDHFQAQTTLADKIRRLSLHYGNAEDAMPPTNLILSQVRTLAYFGVFKCMPSFVEFQLLQVLILCLWGDTDTMSLDITKVSQLFRLRYLKVASNVNLQVHAQMGGPQSLETLQINARVTAVLSDVTHLPGSMHLSLPVETSLPNWIGHMTSLRTLGYIDLNSDSMENMQSLSKLTNLQDLRVTCFPTIHESDNKNKMQGFLQTILRKLGNLRSLTLVSKGYSHVNSPYGVGSNKTGISSQGFSSVSPPTLLRKLVLSPHICIFSCLPKLIGQIGKLCFLKIGINKITQEGVDVLRGLPSLTVLSLYVHTKHTERIIIGNDGFSVLKYFKFKSCDPLLKFEFGAMSSLRKLKLGFNACRSDQESIIPVGLEHLSSLKEVCAKIGAAGSDVSNKRAAELALGKAVKVHKGSPRVSILYVNQIFGCMTDEDKMIQVVPCESADKHDPIRHAGSSRPEGFALDIEINQCNRNFCPSPLQMMASGDQQSESSAAYFSWPASTLMHGSAEGRATYFGNLKKGVPPRHRDQQATALLDLMIIRAVHSKILRRFSLGTAIGFRIRKGTLTNIPAILVFVARKVHRKWLSTAQCLPAAVEGPGGIWCDVDVIEFSCYGAPAPKPKEQLYDELVDGLRDGDPIIGSGSQVSSLETYGTLGAIVKSRTGNKQVGFLTNRHVAVDLDYPNQKMFHPLPPNLGPGVYLGAVERATSFVTDDLWYGIYARTNPETFVRADGAFIPFADDFDITSVSTSVKGVGTVGDVNAIDLMSPIGSLIGRQVVKVGRSSGMTTGTVVAYALEYNDEKGICFFTDFLVVGENQQTFDLEGDSGSLIILTGQDGKMPQPIGIIWGGTANRGRLKLKSGQGPENWTSGVDLGRLLNLLELDLITTSEGLQEALEEQRVILANSTAVESSPVAAPQGNDKVQKNYETLEINLQPLPRDSCTTSTGEPFGPGENIEERQFILPKVIGLSPIHDGQESYGELNNLTELENPPDDISVCLQLGEREPKRLRSDLTQDTDL